MPDVTRILRAIRDGDPRGAADLVPLVYDELRGLAKARLRREPAGHTLQATALVHEAYVRLVGDPPAGEWESRAHFFAAAAEAMRRILVESARRKKRQKHGGGRARVELDDDAIGDHPGRQDDVLAIDDALTHFSQEDPIKAQLVKLRYYAGLSLEEAAGVMGISPATADRYWAFARAWLYRQLKD